MTLLAEGHLAPLVAEAVPLEDARRAHEILGGGGIAGKLVIVPSQGFGVGSTIPLGPCYTVAQGRCEQRWHGFVSTPKYHGSLCDCWIKVGTRAESLPRTVATFGKQPWFFIYTRHGRVTGFYFALAFVD